MNNHTLGCKTEYKTVRGTKPMAGLSPEDRQLLEPPPAILSEMIMFTCTYVATLDNIARSHESLTHVLEPKGVVKAINSNFGHRALPGFESFLKHPKPAKLPEKPGANGLAPVAPRSRKLQGDGTCFNSALEVTIIPDRDAMPDSIKALLASNPDKYYAVKSFPSGGMTQVPGVISPELTDGQYVARLWARYLTEAGVGTDPSRPVTVVSDKPILMNFKCFLHLASERNLLNLAQIVEYLESAKIARELCMTTEGREDAEKRVQRRFPEAWGIYQAAVSGEDDPAKQAAKIFPYPVRVIKNAQDSQNISFKMEDGPEQEPGAKKKLARVNIFYRGKINILNANSYKSAQVIHGFLDSLFRSKWGRFVGLKPLPDKVRFARAARAVAAPKVKPHTIPPELAISNEDLDALLGDSPEPEKKLDGGPLDIKALMALATEFGLDDSALDQVDREGKEDDQEDPLNNGAVCRW